MNSFIRLMMMASRFLLMFYIAYFFDAKAVGEFGLLYGTITFCVFLVGFEHYSISQREIMSQNEDQWLGIIQSQIATNLFLYCLVAPFFILIFTLNLLPWKYFFWFFILLILEHFSQELIRFIAGMRLQFQVSVALFLRSGFWILICLPVMFFFDYRNFSFLFYSWSISCLISIFYSIFYINKYVQLSNFRLPSIKKFHLLHYNSSTLHFFLATSVIKFLFIGDRYLVKYFCGTEILGVYVFFIGIAMTVVSLIDPAITSYIFPDIVSSFRSGLVGEFNKLLRRYALYVMIFSAAISIFLFKFSYLFFNFLSSSIYSENIPIFNAILLSTFIYAVSLVPHYGLIAKNLEKYIFTSNLIAFTVFILFLFIPFGFSNTLIVPLSLQLSFTVLLIIKSYYLATK